MFFSLNNGKWQLGQQATMAKNIATKAITITTNSNNEQL
jgi:hypothetical protein